MDIYKNSVKDLVLNPEFRKWVLHPNPESNKVWEKFLIKNPTALQDVEVARELLLEFFSNQYPLQESEFKQMWIKIDGQTEKEDNDQKGSKIVPINQLSGRNQPETKKGMPPIFNRLWRVAAILVVSLLIGLFARNWSQPTPQVDPIVSSKLKEFTTPAGVKSSITLNDGTKVLLNSGSRLSYDENFKGDKREVFLEGEAFFEVHHDPGKPFSVHTGEVITTALGTSFNVRAYQQENMSISLLTGKVSIEVPIEMIEPIVLAPNQTITYRLDQKDYSQIRFDEDLVMGWTKKMIVFNDTELIEAIRILENWYGVTFHFENQPKPGLNLSGKFENETLENVMNGLRYTAGLDYNIKEDNVRITFKF